MTKQLLQALPALQTNTSPLQHIKANMSGAQIGKEDMHDCRGGENEEDVMEGDEIQYGICWSRRANSYEYQDSSLLSPIHTMDQEVNYHITMVAMV
jgi:hypothetical protein